MSLNVHLLLVSYVNSGTPLLGLIFSFFLPSQVGSMRKRLESPYYGKNTLGVCQCGMPLLSLCTSPSAVSLLRVSHFLSVGTLLIQRQERSPSAYADWALRKFCVLTKRRNKCLPNCCSVLIADPIPGMGFEDEIRISLTVHLPINVITLDSPPPFFPVSPSFTDPDGSKSFLDFWPVSAWAILALFG